MSCYNSERYLRASIDSIIAQDFKDFEFIIWNDGSVDDTEKIVKSYSDLRIRYFYASNQGLGKALNEACKKATGKYIARMDDDDIALPYRLRKELDYMEKHPQCVLVSCAAKHIDSKGEFIGTYSLPGYSDKIIKKKMCIIHPGVMFRRDIYEKTLGYLPLTTSQDRALWKQMAVYGEFANIPEVLLLYRIQENSIGRKKRVKEYSEICIKMVEKISNDAIAGVYNEALIVIHNQLHQLNIKESSNLPVGKSFQNSLEKTFHEVLSFVFNPSLATRIVCFIKNIVY